MKVCDVMTREPATISAESTVEAAVKLMVDRGVSGLPVVDSAGAVVGVLTEGDLLRRVELGTSGPPAGWFASFFAPGKAADDFVRTHGRKVGEVMTSEVMTTTEDALLADVVALMEGRHVKRLPVMRDGRLVGIVSRSDLLRALTQLWSSKGVGPLSDAEVRKRVLAEIGKHRWAPRIDVDVVVIDGVVELRGMITDDRERVGLRVIAENTAGVKAVHDRLMWIEPLSGTVMEAPKD